MDALDRFHAAHDRVRQLTADVERYVQSPSSQPEDAAVTRRLLDALADAVREARVITRDAEERMRPMDRAFRRARRTLGLPRAE